MDTLKRKLIIISFLLMTSVILYSQNDEAIIEAFSNSYTHEYAGDYAKAIEFMKRVNSDNSYEVNLRLGWLTYMSGLFTESITFYQKAITIMPFSIEAKLGYVYPAAALGNWEQVIKQYNDILRIDSKNSTANYRLGLIYYGREDYTTALRFFEQVVNLYPFDYNSTLYYAWTNLKLAKTREAKVLFNKVLMMQPNDSSALEGLSLIR
ncbi:MAG: tetratricopeptide repeat protein [Bacteroidales bacterium]|nr:tetratricopeptide repeat protein [Bacteroidales bacterium]